MNFSSYEETVATLTAWWNTFYNGWLSFMPDNCKLAVLVLAVMLLVLAFTVLHYRRRLARALKGHIHLNRKLDELQKDVYKANDRAANKPDPIGEIKEPIPVSCVICAREDGSPEETELKCSGCGEPACSGHAAEHANCP